MSHKTLKSNPTEEATATKIETLDISPRIPPILGQNTGTNSILGVHKREYVIDYMVR